MANKNDSKNQTKIKGSIVATITNNLNKHGEIKGETKKETKNLKAMCPHHKINKKGKIKPTVWNDGNGICTCEMCGAKIPTHLFEKEEVNKVYGKFKSLLDQARFMAESADLGKETNMFLADLSVKAAQFGKTYGKIKHTVERTEHMKKKKKGKKPNGSGSENYGGWR